MNNEAGPFQGQWSLSPSGAKDGSLPEWLALRGLLEVEELVAVEERALANKKRVERRRALAMRRIASHPRGPDLRAQAAK